MLQKTSMDDSMLTKSIRGLSSSGSSGVIGAQRSPPRSPQNSSIHYSGYLFKRSNRPYEEKAYPQVPKISDNNGSSSFQTQMAMDQSESYVYSYNNSHSEGDHKDQAHEQEQLGSHQIGDLDFLGEWQTGNIDVSQSPLGILLDDDDDNDDDDDHLHLKIRTGMSIPKSDPKPLETSASEEEPLIQHTSSVTTSKTPTHQALHLLSSFFGRPEQKRPPTPTSVSVRKRTSQNQSSADDDVFRQTVASLTKLVEDKDRKEKSTTKPKPILKNRSQIPKDSTLSTTIPSPTRSQPIAITGSGSGSSSNMDQEHHQERRVLPLHLKLRPDNHSDDDEDDDGVVSYPPQPKDYTDPVDGHRWRAKYCVLTDGVLYFYPNAKIGNSKAAERERNRLSYTDNATATNDNGNASYEEPLPRNNVGLDMNADDNLAKSPMPRSLHPMLTAKEKNGGGSFCYDPNVYWEKRVALNMVGAVRSSPDFGEKAFELIAMSATSNNSNLDEKDAINAANSGGGGPSEEVDRLILRADTVHDVNCWIFEIHKSFVYLMKQLATYVGSHGNDGRNINSLNKDYYLSGYGSNTVRYAANNHNTAMIGAQSRSYVPNTSHWGAAVARNSAQTAMAPMSPAAIMGSSFAASDLLSSSLAQAGFRRQKSVRHRSESSSPSSTPKGGSSPVGYSPSPPRMGGIMRSRSDEKIFTGDFIPPPSFPLAKLPTTRSSLRLDSQDSQDDAKDDSDDKTLQQASPPIPMQSVPKIAVTVTPSPLTSNERKILIPPSAGKYIPPHLRGKKYVPPHLRNNKANAEQNISPITSLNQLEATASTKMASLSGNGENNQSKTQEAISDSVSDILDQVRSEDKEFEYLHSNGFGQANEDEEEEGSETPSSSSSSSIEEPVMIKLGGCADPLLIVGSICDPMYKPISASKVGKTQAPAYGFIGDDYELGAVSRCGVRDKNEDAYIILNGLLQKSPGNGNGDNSDDTIDFSESYFSRFKRHGLYAIFDGHCGNHAARFAAEKFHSILLDESCNYENAEDSELDDILREILNASIERLDCEFCDFCIQDGRQWYSGSTAIIALMVDDKIAVASVGDAGGVLSASSKNIDLAVRNGWSVLEEHEEDLNKIGGSKGGIVYREVAESHCPSRPAERERIHAANGWVTHETEIPIISQFQRMNWSDQDVLDIFHRCFSDRFSDSHGKPARILDIYRVCGDLAVSRAIGDREYKAAFNRDDTSPTDQVDPGNNEWKSPAPMPYHTYKDIHDEEHTGIFEGDLVIATPSIQFFQMGSYGDDEFLVIACDGLWDVIDPDDAVRVTRNLIFVLGFSTKECAERLAELAGGLGSSDNITVIVVRFYGKSAGLS